RAQPAIQTTSQPLAGSVEVDPVTGQPTRVDPRFNIDFSGGPVLTFVEAVGRASRTPLNAPAPTPTPPLKLRQVSVPELFEALTFASRKVVGQWNPSPGPYRNYSEK